MAKAKIVQMGDDIELGAVLGLFLAPRTLWAKLVGVPKQDDGLYRVREYRKGDDLDRPTGAYKDVTIISLMPWIPPEGFGKPIPSAPEVTRES